MGSGARENGPGCPKMFPGIRSHRAPHRLENRGATPEISAGRASRLIHQIPRLKSRSLISKAERATIKEPRGACLVADAHHTRRASPCESWRKAVQKARHVITYAGPGSEPDVSAARRSPGQRAIGALLLLAPCGWKWLDRSCSPGQRCPGVPSQSAARPPIVRSSHAQSSA
jgi:hypothetical protein